MITTGLACQEAILFLILEWTYLLWETDLTQKRVASLDSVYLGFPIVYKQGGKWYPM